MSHSGGPRALLLDLDGTLTNPREGIVRCLEHALRALDQPIPAEERLVRCIGPPLWQSFADLLGTDDRTIIDAALRAYRERFEAIGLFENELFPQIPACLAQLQRQRFVLYVATSKPTIYAERIVAHFGLSDCFRAVYGSELDGTRTDKSDLLALLLARESLEPPEALMVGDREHDIRGARARRLRSIGVLWGFGTREELLAAGADRLAESVDDLPRVVASLA